MGGEKGSIFYYEWFDRLNGSVNLESAGADLLAVLYYDRTGCSKPIPQKLMKVIRKDKAACILLETFLERTAAASREWINRHKLKNISDEKQGDKKPAEQTSEKSPEENDDNELTFEDLPF